MNTPGSARIGVDQSFAQRMGDQFSRIARSCFAHDASTVAINSFRANAQSLSDLAIGSTAHDLAQNLTLTVGQWIKVTRFFQLENKIRAEVDRALALAIPLADPR